MNENRGSAPARAGQQSVPPHEPPAEPPLAAAFAALVLGAMAMGASPIFVRLADVGPFASAFWRMTLALPVLWAWLRLESARRGAPPALEARDIRTIALIGFLFAGDLFFWHLAILNTTVANATLLATMTPLVVTLGAWAVLKEKITVRTLAGVALGVAGAVLLVGTSARFAPANVWGDLSGLVTACFFGSYFLAVSYARRRLRVAQVMFYPACVAAGLLLVAALALDDPVMPQSAYGWGVLVSLALISQLGGQGLAAFALGHLPAIFSSLVLFFEAVAAAVLAWLVFAEPVSLWQVGGGALILTGIYAARPERAGQGAER